MSDSGHQKTDSRRETADDRRQRMAAMSGYRKLQVYEKSYKLVLEIYQETSAFPREELYGITGQMRRAAASIPLNIAEGYAKRESQA